MSPPGAKVRRSDVASRFQQIIGPVAPPPVKPAWTVERRFEHGGVQAIALRFEVDQSDEVPALILTPQSGAPHRAALALHQSTRPAAVGKCEAAGMGGEEELAYGLELARRGWAVICPDYPLFGEYAVDVDAVYDQLGYASMSMKGVCNHRAAITVLADYLQTPIQGVGAIGHSLGGTASK